MSKYDIVLHQVHKGDLLQEVVRAYLHGANPSAMLGRIVDGMRRCATECPITSEASNIRLVADELAELRNKVQAQEDTKYSKVIRP